MSKYFAKIENGIVTQVIVIKDSSISTEEQANNFLQEQYKDNSNWLETFEDGSLRGNMASVDDIYDSAKDVFYKTKPFNSWVLNETNWIWEAPIPMPTSTAGVLYNWDEQTLSWNIIKAK
jgi:hypothetical protein